MELEGLWILSLLPVEETATNFKRKIHMELKFTDKWLSGTADTKYYKEDYLFHVHGEIKKEESNYYKARYKTNLGKWKSLKEDQVHQSKGLSSAKVNGKIMKKGLKQAKV